MFSEQFRSEDAIDQTTLEVIAETICVADGGGAGANSYQTPGPYRSMPKILDFFSRCHITPTGQSNTRKWFVLESLQSLNRPGIDCSTELERVLLRLAHPQEYRGDSAVLNRVISHLNGMLALEGLSLSLRGVSPVLSRGKAALPPQQPQKEAPTPAPDFSFIGNISLVNVLTRRWREAQLCKAAEAHLSSVVMMGSILEGVLLACCEANRPLAYRAKAAPKDKAGNPRPLQDWGLNSLIDVASELGWVQGDIKRFSHALRESRNLVHPFAESLEASPPDGDTCKICWQVVQAAVADLAMAVTRKP